MKALTQGITYMKLSRLQASAPPASDDHYTPQPQRLRATKGWPPIWLPQFQVEQVE